MNKTTLHWSYLNFKDVPMDLYLYEDLEEVYLKENFISAIPKWLLNVTTLKFIHLAGNNLNALPEEMYLLENLEFLDVSNNQIHELPKTLGLINRLQRLNISGNELTELPPDLPLEPVSPNSNLRVLLQIGKQFRVNCHKLNMASYYSYPSRSLVDEMHQIAKELTTPARGLLITDDSPFNMDKQFEMFGIESCEAIRIRYRSMLFSTNNKLNEYVSGVAVHPEVLDHTTPNGCALHCQLRRTNILVGVTVDRGLVPLMCSYGEYTSQGLDGLSGRCEQYKDCGCDFTMWRVQYNVSEFTPSYQALIENANTIAKYAAISQSKRMLPILEVDIIPSEYCDLESLEQIAETVLKYIYKSLFDHHVSLEATLLKVPVLNPGPKSEKRSSPGQISRVTLRMLRHAVPFSIGEIGALKQLEELNISKNHLQRLPIQLSECQRLKELNLSDNVNIWHIPERIANLQSLQSLSADRCALIYLPVALSKFLNYIRIFHNTSMTHVPMIYEKFFQSFYDNRSKATPMTVSNENFFWVLEKETKSKLLLPIGTRRIFSVPSIDNQVPLYDNCLRAVQYLGRYMPLWDNIALKEMLPEKFIYDHIVNGPIARCTLFNCSNPLYTSYYFMAVKRRGSKAKQIFTCFFCSNHCANLWLIEGNKKYYQLDWEVCDD